MTPDSAGAGRVIVRCFLLAALVLPATAQEWTRFRGPNGTGVSDVRSIPEKWTAKDYNWRVRLPGGGHSSPVLWGSRIFVTSADETDFSVLCVDERDGELRWKRDFPHGTYNLHKFSSFASATCAVDDQRVYFTRQNGDRMFLCALTHDGAPVWEYPLGRFDSQHGSGHSPVVQGELIILAYDQILEGRILALDRTTGELRWSLPRTGGMADYSVPCVWEQPGRPPVLVFNSCEDGIAGVEPISGRILWKTDRNALKLRSVSSPVIAAGLAFASCGSGGGGNYVIAVAPPTGNSDVAEIRYDIRRSAPYVPTPVAHGGLVFLWSDGGIVTCIDPATGDAKWQERAGGNYFSSPVCVNGRLYGTSDSGEVVVLEAADRFKVVARNDLEEPTRATPAVANGRMYLRTWEHLMSLGGVRTGEVN